MNSGRRSPDESQSEYIQPPIVYVDRELAWEYKVVVRKLAEEDALSEDELNALGCDGWELTGILTDPPLVRFYLKRLVT